MLSSSETSAILFPDDLLIHISDFLAQDVDTGAVYEQLVTLQLVSKQWRRIARKKLYSRVEVVRAADATSLEVTLKEDPTISVDTLVAGVSASWGALIGMEQFERVLTLTPGLRKLVIILADSIDHNPTTHPLQHYPSLASLLDVTILPATPTPSTPLIASALLFGLPHSVRFLQLPLLYEPYNGPHEATFSLYGLTTQAYPSPMADRMLASSRSSLQMLTVGKLSNCRQLAESHLNLRSLRIFDTISDDYKDFYYLQKLERLELREMGAKRALLSRLPESLRYLRFWSTDLGVGMAELLADSSERTIPNLQVLVWDYWELPGGRALGVTLSLLEQACRARSISFKAFPRPEDKPHSIVGVDLPYEAAFRTSCFKMDHETPHFIPSSVRLPFTPFPSRVLCDLTRKSIPISPVLPGWPAVTAGGTKLRPILEDCFEGYPQWLEAVYEPWRKVETEAIDTPLPEPEATSKDWIPDALIPGRALRIYISTTGIFAVATTLTFTVLRHNHAARLALPFAASVLVHAIAWLSYRKNGGWSPVPEEVIGAKTVAALWAIGLAACMFTVLPHSGRVAKGLGITGGLVSILYGIWSLFYFGDRPTY